MIRLSRPPSMRMPRLKPLTTQFRTSAPTASSSRMPYHALGLGPGPLPVTRCPAQSRTVPDTTRKAGEDAHTPTSAVSVVGPTTVSPHWHGALPPQSPADATAAHPTTAAPKRNATDRTRRLLGEAPRPGAGADAPSLTLP